MFYFIGKVSEEQSEAALFHTGKPPMTLSTEVSAFAITKDPTKMHSYIGQITVVWEQYNSKIKVISTSRVARTT
jgi:hypothetical protein